MEGLGANHRLRPEYGKHLNYLVVGCYPEDVEFKTGGSVWQEVGDAERITDFKISQRRRFWGLILKVVWKSAS